MELILERKNQPDKTAIFGDTAFAMVTPPINEDYWEYRVQLGEGQAILGFPKFNTIGVGFALEEKSWNSNLPFRFSTEDIWEHIKRNRGKTTAKPQEIKKAIEMVCEAAAQDRGEPRDLTHSFAKIKAV
jgi:hypothetical protein